MTAADATFQFAAGVFLLIAMIGSSLCGWWTGMGQPHKARAAFPTVLFCFLAFMYASGQGW